MELATQMLQYDPDKRPSAEEILKHQYFSEEPAPAPPLGWVVYLSLYALLTNNTFVVCAILKEIGTSTNPRLSAGENVRSTKRRSGLCTRWIVGSGKKPRLRKRD